MTKRLLKILDKVTIGSSRSLGWEVLITGLSFPASILLNRILGSEQRGLLALVILLPSTIFALGSCQWDRLLTGLITSKQISSKEAWRRTTYYVYYLSFIFIPLGIVASLALDKLPQDDRLISILYYVNFPIYFLNGCLHSIYIASGNLDSQYLMRMALQGSYLLLIFGLFFANLLGVKSLVLVYISIHTISLGIGLIQKNKSLTGITLKERPAISLLKKGFFPYLLESIAGNIDTWSLSIFCSLVSLGQYTAITSIMVPVGLVSNAMTNSSTANLDWTQPILVRRYLIKVVIVLLCLLLMLVIGGVLLGPYLLNLVLGKSFEEGKWMIPWIAAIAISQATANQFHSALQLSGYFNRYLMIQTIEPFVRLIIVLTLGYCLSELGIMIGLTASYVLKIIVCSYFQRR